MELGERLRFIREHFNLTQEKMCAALLKGKDHYDITPQVLSRYEKGSRTPDFDFLKAFCRDFKVNGHWLLCDEGPVYMNAEEKKDVNEAFLALSSQLNSVNLPPPERPSLIIVDIENISQNTPKNFIQLLTYMIKNAKIRRDIFTYFHIYAKPNNDKQILATGHGMAKEPTNIFK